MGGGCTPSQRALGRFFPLGVLGNSLLPLLPAASSFGAAVLVAVPSAGFSVPSNETHCLKIWEIWKTWANGNPDSQKKKYDFDYVKFQKRDPDTTTPTAQVNTVRIT